MLYVKSRKSLRGRREKKFIYLPSAKKTLGKLASLPSVRKITLGKALFAECRKKHSANKQVAEYFLFC